MAFSTSPHFRLLTAEHYRVQGEKGEGLILSSAFLETTVLLPFSPQSLHFVEPQRGRISAHFSASLLSLMTHTVVHFPHCLASTRLFLQRQDH